MLSWIFIINDQMIWKILFLVAVAALIGTVLGPQNSDSIFGDYLRAVIVY